MSDTGNLHALQVVVMQRHQRLANNVVFYPTVSIQTETTPTTCPGLVLKGRKAEGVHPPMKRSAYCCRPMLPIKSAHSSTVHSVMMVSGNLSALVRP